MRCMFFFTVKTCLCALSEESALSFSSLSANPFLWRPLIFLMPCLVRLSLIFFLNGTIDSESVTHTHTHAHTHAHAHAHAQAHTLR